MGLLSDLVAQGRVRNRADLRRVYRRLVKRLHPDSAIPRGPAEGPWAAATGEEGGSLARVEGRRPLPFVDFDELRKELGEAERLLAELDGPGDRPGDRSSDDRRGGSSEPLRREDGGGAEMARGPEPSLSRVFSDGARLNTAAGPATVSARFDRDLLIGELRDLVARGLPVQARALARNKAYRHCVATISAQLALLTGEPDAFLRIDAEMRVVRASSLSLIYHVMQVLWNGLDWGLMGMDWSRLAALRDYGVIRQELAALGLQDLDRLLSWIIEADRPPPPGDRTGLGGKVSR